ncbi:PD-(D/E)XK motif protein [Pseudomonas sp. PE-S1G-1]|uniref:PD-(D/E)XK motif protein n=1 Tax=Pseudomonas sp. PE-S1G-1 TaxID=1986995 RepID=UPI000B3F95C0|nr:PD-(D/E)XK motif protein [Pseudomonas sp. PE-S1G-1]
MALVTEEEMQAIWRPLAGDSPDEGWRSIAMAECGGCRLRAARSSPGNEEALLIGFPSLKLPAMNQLPNGHGFKVEKATLGEVGRGLNWLALVRQPAGSLDLFSSMVVDVLSTVQTSSDAKEELLFQRYLGRIRAWQDFMRRGHEGLSAEEELGLVGELNVLSKLIEAGMPLFNSVDAWKGPLDGLHDFELGSGSIEVKTTIASEGFPACIDSLEQLDDSLRYPFFLAGVKLHLSEEGKNLVQHIDLLRQGFSSDPAALRAFDNCLVHGGYLDTHQNRYTRAFALTELVIHRVDEHFPRLTPFNTPLGVLRARYEIDLGLVQSQKISLNQALQELGVF